MASFELVCEVCEESFEAKSPRAKVCSSTCRSRKRRRARSVPDPEVVDQPDGLADVVETELRAAGRLHTVNGQLALQLARKVAAVDATGVSGLSKEFRAVYELALADVSPADPGPAAAAEPDVLDEVKARRDAKSRKTARRA